MENLNNCDNPGDCQATKSHSPQRVVGNENNSPLRAHHSAAAADAVDDGKFSSSSLTSVAATTMPLALNKLKTQQQQQQQQQKQHTQQPHQHHQFRAPQQFVKHKKASSLNASTSTSSHTSTKTATSNASSLTNNNNNNNSNNSNTNKKNKCWNKRQNRTAKQNSGSSSSSTISNNNTHSSNYDGGGGDTTLATESSSSCGSVITEDNHQGSSKADVENIQNLKNQVGGHNFHNNHYQQHHQHQHQHQQQQHPGIGGGGGVAALNNDTRLSLSITSDKLGYGHGHGLKAQQQQQLHKKPLPTHRGGAGGGGEGRGGGGGCGGGGGHNHHHHHVLCAKSAHNTIGNNNNAIIGGNNINSNAMACCHINGCGSHKDIQSVGGGGNNSNASNSSTTLHYCCLRSKFFLPDKRPRKGNFIPPTKFLLGGNISDPLNLSSLQNEASNASSNTTPATTPRQSPITTPPKVEVIIPPNIHDPLHLLDPVDSMEYEKQLTSPMKRGLLGLPVIGVGGGIILGLRGQTKAHKHRHRKNRKPKRKRYDSINSTASSTMTVDTIDDLMSSGLINASTSTEKGGMTVLTADAAENRGQLLDRDGYTSSSGGGGGAGSSGDDKMTKHNATSSPKKQLSLSHIADSSTTALKVETNLSPAVAQESSTLAVDSSSFSGTISTAGGGGGGGGGGATNVVAINIGELRERACRDLRLDLISTTATGSNSCGSSVVSSIGCGNVSAGGGRKRKISESNNSQKSKKYFRNDSMDKIVSPVVPQPGAWKRPPRTTASGQRKTSSRRSRSISESNQTDLSPTDESANNLGDEIPRDDTPDLMKVDSTSEIGLAGSPLSVISATTSVNAGETAAAAAAEPMSAEATTESVHVSNALILAERVKKEIASPMVKTLKPKFAADGGKYRYGNYDRYAGLRHLNEFMDIRLQVFLQFPELFKNKDILDIGCNVGHMTITVARKLAPKSILGIDIDKELIARARRNLNMYVRIPLEIYKKENTEMEDVKEAGGEDNKGKNSSRRRRKKRKRQMDILQANNANNWQQLQHHHQAMHLHHLHNHHQQHHHHHHHHQHEHQHEHQHQHHHHQHHQHHHHHHNHRHNNSHKLPALVNPYLDATEFFPISFPLIYGGITQPATKATSPQNLESQSPASTSTTTRSTPGHPAVSGNKTNPHNSSSITVKYFGDKAKSFPQNVFFRQTNYVLKDENMLANDTQQYDLILCLSVTKWIHLNFGDAGLKSAFKRMFNQLRPGGKLILEAQNWASYKKKKNLTEDIYNNYHSIELFPNKFHEYLLSSEVGFSHSYTLGVPKHLSKGFSRPIQLYAKGDYTPNHVRWSDAYYPQTPFEAYRGIYATMPPRPTGLQSSYPLISSSWSQNYDTPQYPGSGGEASGPYSCRQTPMHQPSTSQYYNPLESDSYQPSYDVEYLNHMYVFASPLYQTVWSPPTSMRKSSSHTPVFGSVRDAEFEGDGNNLPGGSYHRHVYPPNDELSSPNANASNAFNSIRDPDTDDSNQQRPHVYATTNCESSSSPNVIANESDTALEETLMIDEESRNNCGD